MHKRTQSDVKPKLIEERILTENGDIHIRKYQLGRFLGRGAFASCFELCALDTQHIYAAKVVQKQTLQHTRTKQKLITEVQLHKSLNHSGIVRYEHYFEDSERVYLLLELCGDNLQEVLTRRQRLSELEVQSYLVQLLPALQYLHSSGIIHRDLKPANLFLAPSMALKLGDFGLAARINYTYERRRTICGTPNYIAPEVLDPRLGHSFPADLWSLGVVIYTLLVGVPPFETEDAQTTYGRIRQATYSFPEHLDLSRASKELISSLLMPDPERRFSLDQVHNSLFLRPDYTVPRLLPISSLTAPLSLSFVEHTLAQSPRLELTPPPKAELCEDASGTIWVIKWLNLSAKYGIGYLLSNGVSGVSFNDHSRLLQSGQFITYLSKRDPQTFSSAEPPAALVKKITLLQQFQRFLGPEALSTGSVSLLYVQKWLQTSQAVLFRLSSRVIQVIFRDKAEVLLSADASQLTYVSTQGDRSTVSLAQPQKDPEVAQRLQLTQELLGQLLILKHC